MEVPDFFGYYNFEVSEILKYFRCGNTPDGSLGASWGGLGTVLGPSWGGLGPSWGGLGASWGGLGPSWGGLGTVLGRSWGRGGFTKVMVLLRQDSSFRIFRVVS